MALAKVQGFAEQGGATVITSGVASVTKVERSFPGCSVTVYNTGTAVLANIASDSGGTPKSNPFSSSLIDASWSFYIADGNYDIQFSGTGITDPFTLTDIPVKSVSNVAGGDLTGEYPNPTLIATGVVPGTYTLSTVT